MQNAAPSGRPVWLLVTVLSVIGIGAYLGNERAIYFWDLTEYVQALDTDFPYRYDEPYPFLYPPFALDLFKLTRSHLFELMTIGHVAAAAIFLGAFSRLPARRKFEWLAGVTAVGGLGVVSLLAGNVGALMNLVLLGVLLAAASGASVARWLLPVVIGFGSLIKPQFVLYLGLLLAVEHSRSMAIAKGAVTALAAAVVHGAYYLLRPADWNEYAQAVVKRTVVERDFGWGPAAFMMHFSQSSAAGAAGYLLALAIAAALAYVAWRKRVAAAVPDSAAFVAALAFVVLTFANPRIPLYDLYAAALAVGVCCALSEDDRRLPLVLAALIAAGLLPWLIANFTRAPTTYSWVTTNLLHFHLLGIFGLLAGLAMTGYNRGRQRL